MGKVKHHVVGKTILDGQVLSENTDELESGKTIITLANEVTVNGTKLIVSYEFKPPLPIP